MEDTTPQLVDLGLQLAATAARNTASAITDKIGSMRASKSTAEQVATLEQTVSDLISDKNEVTRIAQAYQQELIAQRLTPGDIRYIAEAVVPIIEQVVDGMGAAGDDIKRQIETLKPLLSVETVNVLQLVGFNFRQAIGVPLTRRLNEMIENRDDEGRQIQLETLRIQRAAMELSSDPEAFARFRQLYPSD